MQSMSASSSEGGKKSRGGDNRCLLYVTLVVLFVCIALVIVLIVLTLTGQKKEPEKEYVKVTPAPNYGIEGFCMSEECVKVAGRMLELMDPSVNPCEDFHRYACSNWGIKHATPRGRGYYNTLDALQDENDRKLKALLEEKLESVPDATSKARILYNSCLNTSSVDPSTLLRLLKEVGDWPVLLRGSWDEEKYDLESLMATLSMYGSHPLLHTYVDEDLQNTYTHTLYLDQPSLSLPDPSYYYDRQHEAVLEAYEEYAKKIAVLLGAFEGTEQIYNMVQFEKRLADLVTPENLRKDKIKLYNKKTLIQLGGEISAKLDWPRFINLIFGKVNKHLNGDDTLVVLNSVYIRNMLDLVSATPKRVVVNYAIWRLVEKLVDHLGQPFLDAKLKFKNMVNPRYERPERWKFCLDYTKDAIPMGLGRIFVDKYFKQPAKQKAMDLLEAVRDKVMFVTEQTQWLSSSTKNRITQQIRNTKVQIGYPEYILNNTVLNKQYEELSVKYGDHLANVLSVEQFRAKNSFKALGSVVNAQIWRDGPYAVNLEGPIFSAGILQSPFFNTEIPMSITHGGAGNYMVAEFIKYFTSQDGWSETTLKNMDTKTTCLDDQYSKYMIPKLKINVDGVATLPENIRDTLTIFHGYQVYQQYLKDKGLESGDLPLFPGVKLTHDQLFFLNHAQAWCYKASYEGLLGLISTSSSPPNIRINGALSNNEDFSRAYNCPLGSPMNPSMKCQFS